MVLPDSSLVDDLVDPGIDIPTRMTEEEFVNWHPELIRAEWVNGEVIVMSPASFRHVEIGNWLMQVLGIYVRVKKLGKLVGPEFMVRLLHHGVSRRVPDLLFISNNRMVHLRKNHLEGAPDLAIEIVSPDSPTRDRDDKFQEYEMAGVNEYWIIDPLTDQFESWARDGTGKFIPTTIQDDGRLYSATVEGFWLKPEWFWQEEFPEPLDCLHQLGVLFPH